MIQFATEPGLPSMNQADEESIEQRARRRVTENTSYAICFRDISFCHADGVLTMQGRLPSFYMKQMLQTLLQGLQGVHQLDNQTDVVSATGLSSVRDQ